MTRARPPSRASRPGTHTPLVTVTHMSSPVPKPRGRSAGCRRWRRCRPAASSSTSTAARRGSRSSPAATGPAGSSGACPRGTWRASETLEQAAVREVAEETGIIGRVLTDARHHRLLVLHGRQARPQGRPPLPARGHRRRADHRGRPGRRGHRRGVVPAGGGPRAPHLPQRASDRPGGLGAPGRHDVTPSPPRVPRGPTAGRRGVRALAAGVPPATGRAVRRGCRACTAGPLRRGRYGRATRAGRPGGDRRDPVTRRSAPRSPAPATPSW